MRKSVEEIAETIIVCSLPASDIENHRGRTGKTRSAKSTRLHKRISSALREERLEVDRLRSLLVVSVLCGKCGKRYTYNRADDQDGEISAKSHGC